MYLLSLESGQTLAGNRDSAWIAGCENCRRKFLEACAKAGLRPVSRPASFATSGGTSTAGFPEETGWTGYI